MGDRIALGFHAAIDYELQWNKEIIEKLCRTFRIRISELDMELPVHTERDMLVASLAFMKEGAGGEFVPDSNEACVRFAERFQYKRTVGGTAARAAIALSKLGMESSLSMCTCNSVMRDLLPEQVHGFSNLEDTERPVFPHVILSYPSGERIQVNDIDFVTPRENRLMYSRDEDSLNMEISLQFAHKLSDVKAFLMGSFSEVLNRDILLDRTERAGALLQKLKPSAWFIFEDACYINKEFRYLVHEILKDRIDVLSMNEDELQECIGRRIDILDEREIEAAIRYVYEKEGVPNLIIHSSNWALAYGQDASDMEPVLQSGIGLSSARFINGDHFGKGEFEAVFRLPDKECGREFCRRITKRIHRELCICPTKELSFVKRPTIVGLGDFFAGGLTAGFAQIGKH